MHKRNPSARARRTPAAIAVLLAGATLAILPACYERVTKAKGIGSEEYTVYESSEDSYIIPPKDKPKGKRQLR